jgi:hypothetical protein
VDVNRSVFGPREFGNVHAKLIMILKGVMTICKLILTFTCSLNIYLRLANVTLELHYRYTSTYEINTFIASTRESITYLHTA